MDKLTFNSKTEQITGTASEVADRIVVEAGAVTVYFTRRVELSDGTVIAGGTSSRSKAIGDMPKEAQAAFALVATDPAVWLDHVPEAQAVEAMASVAE